MWLLPGPRRVGGIAWRQVLGVMHPAMPVRVDVGGLGQVFVDHPAARNTQRPDAFVLLVVAVALVVCANEPATAQREEACAPSISAPPGEYLAENAHAALVQIALNSAYATGDGEMSRCAVRSDAATVVMRLGHGPVEETLRAVERFEFALPCGTGNA